MLGYCKSLKHLKTGRLNHGAIIIWFAQLIRCCSFANTGKTQIQNGKSIDMYIERESKKTRTIMQLRLDNVVTSIEKNKLDLNLNQITEIFNETKVTDKNVRNT